LKTYRTANQVTFDLYIVILRFKGLIVLYSAVMFHLHVEVEVNNYVVTAVDLESTLYASAGVKSSPIRQNHETSPGTKF